MRTTLERVAMSTAVATIALFGTASSVSWGQPVRGARCGWSASWRTSRLAIC
jgi:hypothetical protein